MKNTINKVWVFTLVVSFLFGTACGIGIGFSYAEGNQGEYPADYETQANLDSGVQEGMAGQIPIDDTITLDEHTQMVNAFQRQLTYYYEPGRSAGDTFIWEGHSCDWTLPNGKVVSYLYSYPVNNRTLATTTIMAPDHTTILPYLERFQDRGLKTTLHTDGDGNATYILVVPGPQIDIFE